GTGDVSKSHELWRRDGVAAGFASPLYKDGLLYVVDNAAKLFCLDAATGQVLWEHKLGTVGKASPVWADGKIYVAEVNGNFHILKASRSGVEVLDSERVMLPDGSRFAEIYGSPAVAYGRIYLSTEAGLYCLGDRRAKAPAVPRGAKGKVVSLLPAEEPASPAGAAAVLHVMPAEVLIRPDQTARLRLEAFDARGHAVPAPAGATWTVAGLGGSLDP